MNINRAVSPPRYLLPEMEILPSKTIHLKNGIPLLILHNENQKIIRFDIRLMAGSYFQHKKTIALMTAKSLFEGTAYRDRSNIFSAIDFQGAYMNSTVNKDVASFSIYMPKQAAQIIFEIIKEVFLFANFPEKEISLIKEQRKQVLRVNLEKTSFLAFQAFSKEAFPNHPYGFSTEVEDYDNINRDDLLEFFRKFYVSGNIRLFIAGDINENIVNSLEQTLGEIPQKERIEFFDFSLKQGLISKTTISKPSAMQSSICIGKPLFNRKHRDWMKLNLLNMILGGYFGSRLMSDIREKRGLAYGIHSRMVSYQKSGAFYVHADVNKDKTAEAIDAVYDNFRNLQNSSVLKEELDLVKNYYSGILLRYFDGVFSLLDRYIESNDYSLSINYWLDFLKTIKNTQEDELQLLAQKYLDPSSMIEVVVGGGDKS
ncbi:MAG: insulinase family protein [Bacteroidales bacterium]|nr:insulinase family protein [Bacteroidales bacterium]